ncbi:MAG: hypothetical protein VX460_15185, partial [Planctomycetota bacterium]|nr:hypothetical protein [Planctomycetota bacterium]
IARRTMGHTANPAADQPFAAPAGARAEGVPGALIVGTIAILVVLVSLPRFRAHALEANRQDARLALGLLSDRIFAPEWQAELSEVSAPGDLHEVIRRDAKLDHRFPDARRVEAPANPRAALLHHGYLFDTGHVVVDGVRAPALVAWPEVYGRSGDMAYARTGDGALYGHGNEGLWSGLGGALMDADLADEGWLQLSPPRGPRPASRAGSAPR